MLVTLCLANNCSIPTARAADAVTTLPKKVQRALARFDLDGTGFSAYVQRIGDSSPLLTFNGRQGRNPASAIKLLTTLVALEQLTPVYTWRTDVYADGRIRDGTLNGNLLIRGGGDPYLPLERLWLLVHRLRGTGLHTITGDLLIDQTLFAPIDEDPGAFDESPLRAYNVAPAAWVSNFNVTRLKFTPDRASDRVHIEFDPPAHSLKLKNRLRLIDKGCGGYHRGIELSIDASGTLHLEGRFPRRCQSYTMYRSVLDKGTYSADLFRQLWRESGGYWQGSWRAGEIDQDMRRLLRFESIPLAEVIRSINKYSNNLIARMVFLTLGLKADGAPATAEKSRKAIHTWLALKQLPMPELTISNGAGLSRSTRISAEHMGKLLLIGWHSPYIAEFIASMSLSGMDGTFRKRHRKGSLRGRMHVKTGRLDNVVSLAGYYQSQRGDRYIVVTLHNADNVHRGSGHAVQDALLSWLQERAAEHR